MPKTSDEIQAVRRFAQRVVTYKVFTSDRGSHDTVTSSIIDELVVATAHENQGKFASCLECQRLLESLWKSSVDLGEILASFDRLVAEGRMTRTPTSVELTEACAGELAVRVRTATELETAALAAWESLVATKLPHVEEAEMARLREELIECIRELISDRGIEAAIILYPEQERFKHRLEEIMVLGLREPKGLDPEYALLRHDALKVFFDFMIPIQRQWLLSKLSTAYLMSAFTLDPSAFDAVRRLTTGQRLYFDTNTLFPMMHLHGRRRYEEIHEVIERCRLQGYEICITRWTLKEWKRTMGRARKKLKFVAGNHSPRSVEEERDFETARTILKAHRLHCRDTHEVLTPDEFCEELILNIKYRLTLEGISVVEEGCDQVDADKATTAAHVAGLERFYVGKDEKSLPVLEHDAKMRCLVERLRGNVDRSLSNAGYLFITYDRHLARWATYPESDATPFAVTVDAWLGRLRNLHPRVKDYDETLALLLDTPALHVPDILTHEQVMKVILRISAHERSTPEMNVQHLLDAPLIDDSELEADEFDSWMYEGGREISLAARLEAAEQKIVLLEKIRESLEVRLDEGAIDETQEIEAPAESDAFLAWGEGNRWLKAILCFSCAIAFGFDSMPRLEPWVGVCLALGSIGVGVSLVRRSWGSVFSAIAVISGIFTIALMLKTLLG